MSQFLATLCMISVAGGVLAGHPQVLVTPEDHAAIKTKLEQSPWAWEAFATLKARVDGYLAQSKTNEHWLASRLFLHWTNHYTTAVVEKSRWIGGEGRAPVPPVRFAGARDWVVTHVAPERIEDLRPYNDNADGTIWLISKATGQGEWIPAGKTGRQVEIVNARVMQAAADAAFVYWLTGDEACARMAADVLWTYLEGFAHVTPPRIADNDRSLAKIIGLTSFEVIHEEILPPLGLAYDFLHDHLVKQGRDVRLIQSQLKRMADRVIEGGGREGNWNLNQAFLITYAVLALEDNESYPDGRGRQHYVDILLNADLPRQRGLLRVIAEDFDKETALWPEAAGYAFGTTPQIIQIASLLGNDPQGQAILNNPILPRAILAQLELLHPNGWSTGLGDTYQTRVNAPALELMIAAARRREAVPLEERLTGALQREIAAGQYKRERQVSLVALTQYVPELKSVTPGLAEVSRSYFGQPLNVVFQRNFAANPDHALSAAMYGTDGGHVHANGLAIELYGAGVIMGADPGRGSSYWQPEHGEYYSQPPAHNTVIVNGRATYPAHGPGHIPMRVEVVEPAFGGAGVSPNLSFVQASFDYKNPAATQQRTLALIRTSDKGGFYFDVFRSRAKEEAGSFHDYIYHNVGQSLALQDASGKALPLESTSLLAATGPLPGYKYFQNERSLVWKNDVRGQFALALPDGPPRAMNGWMPGAPGRKVFSLAAPANRAGRDSMPASLNELPMPTLLVRQAGEAWSRPFVAVYEPFLQSEGAGIIQVRAARPSSPTATLAAVIVEGKDFRACLMQDDQAVTTHAIEGNKFQGRFGAVIMRKNEVSELYLGSGRHVAAGFVSLASASEQPVAADLRRTANGWICSASGPVNASVIFEVPADFDPSAAWTILRQTGGRQLMAEAASWRLETSASDGKIIVATCLMPAGQNQEISFGKP